MTGPCKGKIPIDVKLEVDNKQIPCQGYVHVKGYARANVTHLDLEGFNIQGLERGSPGVAIGRGDHITIILMNEAIIGGIKTKKIRIAGLNLLKKGEKMGIWMGVKEGGLYVGFKKEGVKRLEEIAKMLQPELFTDMSIRLNNLKEITEDT